MITALVNRKGGVAKTTTAMNLGIALAKFHHKKVLLLDLDPQGNLSSSFGFSRNGFKRGTHLLFDSTDISSCVYDSDWGIKLIPADERLDHVKRYITKQDFLSNLSALPFDHVLIDCSPSKDILTENAIFCADQIVMPMGLDGFSVDGVNNLLDTIDNIKKDEAFINCIHVLFTNYESQKTLINSVVEKELEPFKRFLCKTRIRKDANVVKAQMAKISLFDGAKNSKAAIDYQDFTKEFLRRTKKGTK